MPVLLYGSENWVMTENLLGKLESFQAELVKRILKWPKHFSNTAAITVLDVPTMECRVLERKLSFLQRVMGGKASGLSSLVKESFCDEISSLCLVKECRDLEEAMQTEFTEGILKGETVGARQRKKEIQKIDRDRVLARCEEKYPMVAEVANDVGWAKLWDTCLSLGTATITGLQKLSMAMAHHGRGSHPCPLCDMTDLEADSVLEHITGHHREQLNLEEGCSVGKLMGRLKALNVTFLPKFRKLFNLY